MSLTQQSNDHQIDADVYAFLIDSVPKSQRIGHQSIPINVTCLDVNDRFLAFGSNVGSLFVYRRKARVSDTAHFICTIVDDVITHVMFTTQSIVMVCSLTEVIFWDLATNRLVGRFSADIADSWDVDAFITAVNVSFESPERSFVFLGNSAGQVVRYHPSTADTSLVYQETQNLEGHLHHVVQIEVISSDIILVSTCRRSAIVTMNHGSDCIVQIGKNERKSCGSFGAIHFTNDDLIYAARPSTHLVRADLSSGQVLETFILKKAPKPEQIELLSQFKKSAFNGTTTIPVQLGRLVILNSTSLLSWSQNCLLIIDVDGSVILYEVGLIDICEVKCIRKPRDLFEIFVLFKSRHLVCLSTLSNQTEIEETTMNGNNSESCTDDDGSPTNFMDLLELPFKIPTINVIENNLKQVIQNLQSRLVDGDTNDENETPNEVSLPEYLKDDVHFENQNDSLVVLKRKSKKRKKKNSGSPEDILSIATKSTLSSETSSMSSYKVEPMAEKNISPSEEPQSQVELGDHLHCQSIAEDEKLKMILAAFPSENEIIASVDISDVMQVNFEDEVTIRSESPKEEVSQPKASEVDTRYITPPRLNTPVLEEETSPIVIIDVPTETGNPSEIFEPRMEDEVIDLTLPEFPNPYKFITEDKVYIKWNLLQAPDASLKPSLMSATGFDDESCHGAVLVYNHRDRSLVAVPGCKKIKLPKSDIKVCVLDACHTKIVLLDEDGNLYVATDWQYPRFLLGIKWDKINTSRTGSHLMAASVNSIDMICWFVDGEGCSWVHKLKSSSWILARDEHIPALRLRKVTVSPRNSAIVWAMDYANNLYVRQGIFNDKSDADRLIAGIDWVPVDMVHGNVKLFCASIDSLWVVTSLGDDEHLYRRIGIDPPQSYIGTEWEEVVLPPLIQDGVLSLSCSSSGDLYLLTTNGLMYQYCIHETIPLKAIDDGWLLI